MCWKLLVALNTFSPLRFGLFISIMIMNVGPLLLLRLSAAVARSEAQFWSFSVFVLKVIFFAGDWWVLASLPFRTSHFRFKKLFTWAYIETVVSVPGNRLATGWTIESCFWLCAIVQQLLLELVSLGSIPIIEWAESSSGWVGVGGDVHEM